VIPEHVAGRAVRDARSVPGGDINDAYALELDDGSRAFLKTRDGAAPGEFATEADGLRWLAEPGALRLPAVLDVGEDWLALEWVDAGRLDAAGEEELGRGLAQLHQAGAERFGADEPMRLRELALPNDDAPDWATFYAEQRLRPLAAGSHAVEAVCDRITELAGPAEPPARLHGDLWSGNVMAGADGRPWLIDPAAYGGHREVDLAMLKLFGAPSARTMAAYEEVAPLADGHEERVALYQLFPLLVHAALFGGGYAASAERAARGYI
jgi:fructosamine-3-kinase